MQDILLDQKIRAKWNARLPESNNSLCAIEDIPECIFLPELTHRLTSYYQGKCDSTPLQPVLITTINEKPNTSKRKNSILVGGFILICIASIIIIIIFYKKHKSKEKEEDVGYLEFNLWD